MNMQTGVKYVMSLQTGKQSGVYIHNKQAKRQADRGKIVIMQTGKQKGVK